MGKRTPTKDALIVVDMQTDFVGGVPGIAEAVAIVPAAAARIKQRIVENETIGDTSCCAGITRKATKMRSLP